MRFSVTARPTVPASTSDIAMLKGLQKRGVIPRPSTYPETEEPPPPPPVSVKTRHSWDGDGVAEPAVLADGAEREGAGENDAAPERDTERLVLLVRDAQALTVTLGEDEGERDALALRENVEAAEFVGADAVAKALHDAVGERTVPDASKERDAPVEADTAVTLATDDPHGLAVLLTDAHALINALLDTAGELVAARLAELSTLLVWVKEDRPLVLIVTLIVTVVVSAALPVTLRDSWGERDTDEQTEGTGVGDSDDAADAL